MPALWQINSESYKNRNAKLDGYEAIAKSLGDQVPGLTAQCVRIKWNNFKSCYLREKRRVNDTKR